MARRVPGAFGQVPTDQYSSNRFLRASLRANKPALLTHLKTAPQRQATKAAAHAVDDPQVPDNQILGCEGCARANQDLQFAEEHIAEEYADMGLDPAAYISGAGGNRDRRGLRRRGRHEQAGPHCQGGHGAALHQPTARSARLPGRHRPPCSWPRNERWADSRALRGLRRPEAASRARGARSDKNVSPATFGRALSTGEIALGAALLAPVVPATVAGAGLAVFGGGFIHMYLKLPG